MDHGEYNLPSLSFVFNLLGNGATIASQVRGGELLFPQLVLIGPEMGQRSQFRDWTRGWIMANFNSPPFVFNRLGNGIFFGNLTCNQISSTCLADALMLWGEIYALILVSYCRNSATC